MTLGDIKGWKMGVRVFELIIKKIFEGLTIFKLFKIKVYIKRIQFSTI